MDGSGYERDIGSHVEDASISELQRRMSSGEIDCQSVVDGYLDRIAHWDRAGPKLASVLTLNPRLRELAAAQDSVSPQDASRPLRGITVAVKDNCNTADMPTTGGSKALRGVVPDKDSAVVRKLARAGAIIIAKTNLHELALAGITVSSLGGQTLNPYDLGRTPGGSSGGTGVAVTMSFATVGIGTDTVNSIRSPAYANSIVGLRPSRGLVSRAGVIPVSSTQDVVGPMARTVADVARVLDVIAGYDPDDAITARCKGRIPQTYTRFLDPQGLKGKRIGLVCSLQGTGPDCREVNRATEEAMAAMRDSGAEVLPLVQFRIDADDLIQNLDVQKWEFKRLFESYLRGVPTAPVRRLDAFMRSGGYHPTLEDFLAQANGIGDPDHDDEYLGRLSAIDRLRGRVLGIMEKYRLDALAYPLQKCLVVPVGSPAQRGRNGILAALAGFPAMTVPMGFSQPTAEAPIGVPMGLDLMARPFQEPSLFEIAYAFEQAVQARRLPSRSGWRRTAPIQARRQQ
jgi:Asp-tRNA(Asn)/Glu-tRNA(Gln) amidotransferase A subunit family amidase